MTNSGDELPQIVEGMRQFNLSLSKSIAPFRWVGYFLFVLSVLGLIALLVPLQVENPEWVFRTMGNFVEQSPVLLIALLLIFFGEMSLRGRWERPIVVLLSWLCLVFAIIFFALLPVGVGYTFRVNQDYAVRETNNYQQQLDQALAVENQLNEASTEDIMAILQAQNVEVEVEDPDQVKELLRSELNNARDNLTATYESVRAQQRTELVKNSVKWNIGTILLGVLMIYLWRSTRWARGAKG